MTCQDMLELLSASVDGELTRDEQAQLDAHLNTCPACRALYAELAGLHAADWTPEVPPELTDRVLNALPAQRSGKVIYWKRWGAMAAAIALVALAAWRLPLRPPADPGITADTTGAVNQEETAVDDAPEAAQDTPMLASAMDESLPLSDAPLPTATAKLAQAAPEATQPAAAGAGETRSAKSVSADAGSAETQSVTNGAPEEAPAQAPAPVEDAPVALFSMPLPSPAPELTTQDSQDAPPILRSAMLPEAVPEQSADPAAFSEIPESPPSMSEEEQTLSALPFEDLTQDERDFSSYRYVLTLSPADWLEDYPHQLQSSGEMWYLLPLEIAEALPQTLAESDPSYALRDTGEDLTADAPYALAVVAPAP